MTIVALRGPCNRLSVELDTAQRIILDLCPRCSKAEGRPVYHCFDADTGDPIAADEV